MVTISVLKKVSKSQLADLNRLMIQLRTGQKLTRAKPTELKNILADKNVIVVVAVNGIRIVGVGTLYVIQKIGKRIGSVEDVVVDEEYRGQGLGEKIMRKLITKAREKKLNSLGLTSRPERVAGNKLYQKLGFKIKETNAYRLGL